MGNRFTGRSCPVCGQAFTENDAIVLCGRCQTPHHADCFRQHGGCGVSACTGRNAIVVEQRPAAQPAEAVVSGRTEVIFSSAEALLQDRSDVLIENVTLLRDENGKVFANCTMRSLTSSPISEVMLDLQCRDGRGDALPGVSAYPYLNLRTYRGGLFGQNVMIPLPDANACSAAPRIRTIHYADGRIVGCTDAMQSLPPLMPLAAALGTEEAAAQFARETNPGAKFIPFVGNDFWRCACGSVNRGQEGACPVCGSDSGTLMRLMNDPDLGRRAMQYRQPQQMNPQYQQPQQRNPQYQAVQQVQAEAAPQQPAGEQQKRQRTGKKKSRVILAVVLSLLGLAAAAALTIFLLLPTINYSRAEKAMDDKDYDTAHEIFASLNGFKDSEDRANDALYRKAKALLKDKKYDEAAEQFRALGSYSDAKKMVQEASYQKGLSLMEQKDYEAACEIFQELGSYSEAPDRLKAARYQIAEKYMDDENYREAYLRFTDLGDYNDSKERVTAALLLWEASVLGGGDTSKADDFAKTVKLNSDQYEDYYSTILLFLTGHEEAEFFYDPYYSYGLTDEALSARKLLGLLPSTYEDTQTLIDLFDAMEYADYCRLFPDNEALMRECFSIPFVRDLAMDDYQIIGFLEGRWTGGGYYLQFDEDRYSSYDLPWVAEPEGAAYYSIENGIFYFDNENNDHLAEVYSFTIVDYDTIQVYCYKDGYTYTMRR